MYDDDRPTTITGALTGTDPIATRPRAVALMLSCAFLVPLVLVLAAVGMTYPYDQRSPVVREFRVLTQFVPDDESVLIDGTLNKVRACDFVGLTAKTADGRVSYVAYFGINPGAPFYSHPLGPQKFGPWRVLATYGEGVTLYAMHRCHFLWTHYEVLGGFVVGQQ